MKDRLIPSFRPCRGSGGLEVPFAGSMSIESKASKRKFGSTHTMVPLDRVSFSCFYVPRMLSNFNSIEMPFFKLHHVEMDFPRLSDWL
jgi:hypothetical protein